MQIAAQPLYCESRIHRSLEALSPTWGIFSSLMIAILLPCFIFAILTIVYCYYYIVIAICSILLLIIIVTITMYVYYCYSYRARS